MNIIAPTPLRNPGEGVRPLESIANYVIMKGKKGSCWGICELTFSFLRVKRFVDAAEQKNRSEKICGSLTVRLSAFYYSFAHTIYGLQFNDDNLKSTTHFSIPFSFRPYVECFDEREINQLLTCRNRIIRRNG